MAFLFGVKIKCYVIHINQASVIGLKVVKINIGPSIICILSNYSIILPSNRSLLLCYCLFFWTIICLTIYILYIYKICMCSKFSGSLRGQLTVLISPALLFWQDIQRRSWSGLLLTFWYKHVVQIGILGICSNFSGFLRDQLTVPISPDLLLWQDIQRESGSGSLQIFGVSIWYSQVYQVYV